MTRYRDKMLEDMKLAGLAPATHDNYLRSVRDLVEYSRKPPRRITRDDVRSFLLDLMDQRGLSASSHKVAISAFKFFFRTTLDRPEVVAHLPFPKVDSELPDVLSGTEVVRLIEHIVDMRLLAVVALIYSTGLRLSEVVRLEPRDIDSDRMLVHIRLPKNRHSRFVPLSPRVLQNLRDYWRILRPTGPWLFPGERPEHPIARDTIQRSLRLTARRAGIDKRVTPHVLRHTAATHMLESGVDLRTVQVILGHQTIRSTCRYLHVTHHQLRHVRTPLDVLGTPDAHCLG